MKQRRDKADEPAGTLRIGVSEMASPKVLGREGSKTEDVLLSDPTRGRDELGKNCGAPIRAEGVC